MPETQAAPIAQAAPPALAIVGPASLPVEHAYAYSRQARAQRQDRVDAYAAELWRVCALVGYDPAVLFAQWAVETGVGSSPHWVKRLNPAGLGLLGDPGGPVQDLGYSWPDGAAAARGHVAHMSAYVAGYEPKAQPFIALDRRWQAVFETGFAATVRTTADLGSGRWATDPLYAAKLAGRYRELREAIVAPSPTPAAPEAAPLPAGIVQRPSGNWHWRTGGRAPVAIVYHISDDLSLANVLAWLTNPLSEASAHAVIAEDGTIHQLVSSTKAAWTNGDFDTARQDIPWLLDAIARCQAGRNNLNDFTLAIEHIGKPGRPLTEAQYASSIALSAYWRDRYELQIDRGHCLRHSDINGRTRAYCPGPAFDLARIIRSLGGDPAKLA